jgi:hypothetical protein
MDNKESSTKESGPKGMPLWVALVGLLAVAVIAIGALVYMIVSSHSETARLARELEAQKQQQAQVDLDKQRGETQAALNLARMKQDEVLAHARNATNLLAKLLAAVTTANAEANALQTSDTGKAVAQHADLVAQARRLYDVNLPDLAASALVVDRLEGIRRIEYQISSQLGTGYSPDAKMMVESQTAAVWAEQELRRTENVQTLISSLATEAKVKLPPEPLTTQSATLAATIEALKKLEAQRREQKIIEITGDAKEKATELIAAGETNKIITEAKILSERSKSEAEQAMERFANQERITQSKMTQEAALTDVTVLQNEEEATRTRLRQQASTPRVQTVLAPFTTPGYRRVKGAISLEKQPHSFNELKGSGALEPTPEGLRTLTAIARDKRDTLRPRVAFKMSFLKDPVQLEQALEMQKLLSELGPVMVEMGMLAE